MKQKNCKCFDRISKKNALIYENKDTTVSFSHIKRINSDRKWVSMGYGVYVSNSDDIDKAFKFKFCPFCGKEFVEEK